MKSFSDQALRGQRYFLEQEQERLLSNSINLEESGEPKKAIHGSIQLFLKIVKEVKNALLSLIVLEQCTAFRKNKGARD